MHIHVQKERITKVITKMVFIRGIELAKVNKRINELVGKLIIMKEFCDYMTIVNFLKGSAYCQVYYDVYFECSRLIQKYGKDITL